MPYPHQPLSPPKKVGKKLEYQVNPSLQKVVTEILKDPGYAPKLASNFTHHNLMSKTRRKQMLLKHNKQYHLCLYKNTNK